MSDTHFHNWTEFSKPDDTYANSRLGEQIEALEKVFEIAIEEEADVIFAGDLFHKRQSVDTRVFNAIYDVFERYEDVQVYGIPGNHDKVTNSLYSDSSIDTFKYVKNTKISTKLEQIELEDTVLTMVPYGDEIDEIKEFLNGLEPSEGKKDILVAHLGVSGSLVGKGGHRMEGAFSYEDLKPELFDYIMLGHYHRAQVLQENGRHVYVGVLTQNSFSEEEHPTGVVLIDTETESIKRIPIETTKFKTLTGDNVPDDIEDVLGNSYVRFTGDRGQAKALENLVGDLTNVRINIEETKEIETRIEIDQSSDPLVITEKYMEEYHPKSTDKALECIKEALLDAKV